jgi:lipooligosaccharide transport system ATP-binding protein
MSHGAVVAQGSPKALLAEHVGEHATEYFGPPQRLAEIEAQAARSGMTTRRTGPSISILGSERHDREVMDQFGDGLQRVANLEDVFVLLTGEVLE